MTGSLPMKIHIETIPKSQDHHCGYLTCGDWWVDEDGTLQIRVTETGDDDSDTAVAIHELTEAKDCIARGITEKEVCAFDMQFEAERITGRHSEDAEPGDDPRSPYRESHQRANHVERAYCHARDLLWDDHERAVATTQ